MKKSSNEKELKFMFMDESVSPEIRVNGTRIGSLTGIILSAQQCIALRESFLKVLKPLFTKANEKGINEISPIPEIHGSCMLPTEDDSVKLRYFKAVAELMAKSDVNIYRVGYYLTPEYLEMFKADKEARGLCWHGLLLVTQQEYEDSYLVPIMDSVNKEHIGQYCSPIQTLLTFRSIGWDKDLSIRNSENIIGEVFFADSRYSILTQVVDVVAYLRCIQDQANEGVTMTSFKKQLLYLNEIIGPQVKYDKVTELRIRTSKEEK